MKKPVKKLTSKKTSTQAVSPSKKNTKLNLITTFFQSFELWVFLLVFLFFGYLYAHACTQGTFVFQDYRQGAYYTFLADVFEKGMLGYNGQAPGGDWSFYNGINYLYFGPLASIILLLLRQVFHVITTVTFITYISSLVNIVFAYLIIRLVTNVSFKRNYWIANILFFITYCIGPLFFLSSRYFVYETSILLGSTAALISFYFFLLYLFSPSSFLKRVFLINITSFFLALSFFSRINLIVLFISYLLFIAVKEYKVGKLEKNNNFMWVMIYLFGQLMSFVFVAVLLFGLYNVARFGNFFEFGQRYQISSSAEANIRLASGSSTSIFYVFLNLFDIFFNFPSINSVFPYVHYKVPEYLVGPYPLLLDLEKMSSVFYSAPVLLFSLITPIFIFAKRFAGKTVLLFIMLALLIIMVPTLASMGYARRYYQDYYIFIVLLSSISYIFLWNRFAVKSVISKFIWIVVTLLILVWIFFLAVNLNCQFGFAGDFNRCLSPYNDPKTFFGIS